MGFPSPAADYIGESISLDRLLIKNPPATYFMRVAGGGLKGIQDNDLIIVDRSLDGRDGQFVITVINQEFCLRQMEKVRGRVYLVGEGVAPVKATRDNPLEIWGIVTSVIRQV